MQYEYHTEETFRLLSNEKLNELGKDGWRLVSFVSAIVYPQQYIYIFVRKLEK